MTTNTYRRYTQAYQKAAVNTVDQKKLIVMLYDGAIKFLSLGIKSIEAKEFYEAHTNVIRGKSIIAELLASLDYERGGEIATNLQRLYAYMFNELIDANLNRDVNRLNHVLELLKELRTAWRGMQSPKGDGISDAAEAGRTKPINLRG
ncbi:MAG: flagellar export chaperone FliS [SAR324 cluster bacterium]|nr:flagellar export chaperone FliS [SAR324 cluster bacterium]